MTYFENEKVAFYIMVKIKVSSNKSWRLRGGMECWASILTLRFGTTLYVNTKNVSKHMAGGIGIFEA
jgi:hypothetical protein